MTEEYDGKPDETGTLFVDILFALVVTQILTPLKDPEKTTFLGGVHLAVAFVLTLLSWIGYHNSRSRADARLRFPTISNLDKHLRRPHANKWHYFSFAQFMLDVAMVVVYWMASITYERSNSDTEVRRALFWYWPAAPSAFPEALAVVVSFGLYWLWDCVGRREAAQIYADADRRLNDITQTTWVDQRGIARAHENLRRATERIERRRRRRRPTEVAGLAAFVVLLVAFFVRSRNGVFTLDVLLILTLIVYRYAKETVVAGIDGA